MQVRIFADDLSGAADCAASFTGAVGAMPLFLRDRSSQAASFALDADSRTLHADAAAARWRELARAHGAEIPRGTVLFKKIDSTLRGHVVEELAAFLGATPGVERIVIAPAFPEQGRTFVDGRLLVHGKPQAANLTSLQEQLHTALDRRPLVMPMTLAEQGDLTALVREMRQSNARTLWVGSSGLARALAGAAPRRIDATVLQPPTLIVVGSFSTAARDQARAFGRENPGNVLALSPNAADMAMAANRAAEVMKTTGRVLLHLESDEIEPAAASRKIVEGLAAALHDLAQRSRTLVVTGGDTARAMLAALGVEALTIEGELEPGISVSAPVEGHGFRAVLKAGGFGDNGVFLRCLP
jgi:uncharacterized protein YgbK (DUF1537 family)